MNVKLCTKGSCCPDFDPDFQSQTVKIVDDNGNEVTISMAEYEKSIEEYNKQKHAHN